jgi:GT2 family glycosyltransferase
MDLSVVIVNHNSTDLLLELLQSIAESPPAGISYEVIVVDNASEQSPVAAVQRLDPDVQVLSSTTNEGFARANNRGIGGASGRYLLFLNPDMVMRPHTIETMIKYLDSNPPVGAASCFVQLPSGDLDDASHRGFPTPWNALCHFSGLARLAPRARLLSDYSMGWAMSDHPHRVDAIAGCFMLVRRSAGEGIGWWDEDYFFYGEDLDFCYRLRASGWTVAFVPNVSILHYKGMSSGIKKISRNVSRADRATQALATRARFDAMKIFYAKHYQDVYPAPIRWLVLTGIAAKYRVALWQLNRAR